MKKTARHLFRLPRPLLLVLSYIFLKIRYCSSLQTEPDQDTYRDYDYEIPDPSRVFRIIGGEAAVRDEFPFLVYIQLCNLFETSCSLCGGALIHKNYVITAAHCKEDTDHINIRLGYHSRLDDASSYTEYRVDIDQFLIHPDYDSQTVDNDIGLIQIPGTHGIAEEHLVSLPFDRPRTGDILSVAGWGVLGGLAQEFHVRRWHRKFEINRSSLDE